MKIYLSSPFFNDMEIANVRKAQEILKEKKLKVWVPLDQQVEEKGDNKQWAKTIFKLDVHAIDRCDAMVLLYYGMYSDSGTAWEAGYAYAKNIPIIVIHCQDKEKNNLMMTNGCHTNLPNIEALKKYDFSKLAKNNEFFGHTKQS